MECVNALIHHSQKSPYCTASVLASLADLPGVIASHYFVKIPLKTARMDKTLRWQT